MKKEKNAMTDFFDELQNEMKKEEMSTLSNKHKVKISYETGLVIFEVNGKEFYFRVNDKIPGHLIDDIELYVEKSKPEKNLSH